MTQDPVKRYRKKRDASVIAVQLDLDTQGFTYNKWGSEQTCKAGDWLVSNAGDTYTVDKDVFDRTYALVSPGVYVKTTEIWARLADSDGSIETKEGVTHFKKGDYVVSNNADGSDGYAVAGDKFHSLYELIE